MEKKLKQTMMRADPALLAELRKLKVASRESYSDVVKRLIKKESKIPKGLTAWERENWREIN